MLTSDVDSEIPVVEEQAYLSSNMDKIAQPAVMDDNTTTESLVEHVSLALSLPYEMVEAILVYLTVPELLLAAPHLPKLWRDVIGTSRQIWKNIARYDYDDNHNVAQNGSGKRPLSNLDGCYRGAGTSTRCFLLGGQLFIHQDSFGNDGFIFAPGREELPLKILDSKKRILRHRQGLRVAKWSIELYDLDGELVWHEDVTYGSKIAMGRYLLPVFENHVAESDGDDLRAKRRKRGGM